MSSYPYRVEREDTILLDMATHYNDFCKECKAKSECCKPTLSIGKYKLCLEFGMYNPIEVRK